MLKCGNYTTSYNRMQLLCLYCMFKLLIPQNSHKTMSDDITLNHHWCKHAQTTRQTTYNFSPSQKSVSPGWFRAKIRSKLHSVSSFLYCEHQTHASPPHASTQWARGTFQWWKIYFRFMFSFRNWRRNSLQLNPGLGKIKTDEVLGVLKLNILRILKVFKACKEFHALSHVRHRNDW